MPIFFCFLKTVDRLFEPKQIYLELFMATSMLGFGQKDWMMLLCPVKFYWSRHQGPRGKIGFNKIRLFFVS